MEKIVEYNTGKLLRECARLEKDSGLATLLYDNLPQAVLPEGNLLEYSSPVPRPTLYTAARWLRMVKGYYVSVNVACKESYDEEEYVSKPIEYFPVWQMTIKKDCVGYIETICDEIDHEYNDYDHEFEYAIVCACEHILNEAGVEL